VSVIDRKTDDDVDTLKFLPPGFRAEDVTPVGMLLSDDLKTAFVSMGRANNIAFVDIATHKVQGYVLVGSRAWNMTESGDHKYLYVANGLSDDVSIIDLATRKNIKTISAGRTPHSILVDAPGALEAEP
jgi:YVTN family beta-propeller protein